METLHFTIGEDFGLMITNVAQEKVLCDEGGIGKALEVLDTAMPNSPYSLLMDVLEGRKVLEVDVEDQVMVLKDYDAEKHSEYRQFDARETEQKIKDYLDADLKNTRDSLMNIIEENQDYFDRKDANVAVVTNVAEKLTENFFKKEEPKYSLLDSYLQANREIDKKLDVDEYLPNDILDLDSAGWLAPNGDWYGLNGTLANMLHNQIADTLFEKGIIKGDEHKGNPDQILNQDGWVRIHDGWILYDGYYYDKAITPEQKKAISDYAFEIQNRGGRLRLGLHQTQVSAGQWGAIEPLQLKMKWFKI